MEITSKCKDRETVKNILMCGILYKLKQQQKGIFNNRWNAKNTFKIN